MVLSKLSCQAEIIKVTLFLVTAAMIIVLLAFSEIRFYLRMSSQKASVSVTAHHCGLSVFAATCKVYLSGTVCIQCFGKKLIHRCEKSVFSRYKLVKYIIIYPALLLSQMLLYLCSFMSLPVKQNATILVNISIFLTKTIVELPELHNTFAKYSLFYEMRIFIYIYIYI